MPEVNPRGSKAEPAGPAAQPRPAPAPEPEVGYDRVFSLLNYEVFFNCEDCFMRALAAHAAKIQTTKAAELRKKLGHGHAYRLKMQSHYEKLTTSSAIFVLRALVINSPLLTTAERLVLEVQQSYIKQYGLPMTRATLAKLLLERECARKRAVNTPPNSIPILPTVESLAVEVGRIFDSGGIYDLIDRCPVQKGTERPVVATAALVELVTATAAPAAVLLQELIPQLAALRAANNNKPE